MYCRRCETYQFGGSRCPSCGDLMERGGAKFSRTGEPLARSASVGSSPGPASRQGAGPARAGKEVGKSEGLPLRLAYKLIESVCACALFSVALRCAVFLVKVADSLMRTGGDVEAGISLVDDIRRAIEWYEIGGWVILTVLIFVFRRNPR